MHTTTIWKRSFAAYIGRLDHMCVCVCLSLSLSLSLSLCERARARVHTSSSQFPSHLSQETQHWPTTPIGGVWYRRRRSPFPLLLPGARASAHIHSPIRPSAHPSTHPPHTAATLPLPFSITINISHHTRRARSRSRARSTSNDALLRQVNPPTAPSHTQFRRTAARQHLAKVHAFFSLPAAATPHAMGSHTENRVRSVQRALLLLLLLLLPPLSFWREPARCHRPPAGSAEARR